VAVRFSEAQIRGFLREAAAGRSVMELSWNHCFSRSTFRAWKAKYGAAVNADTERLKQLELENARPRETLARANSDAEGLCERTSVVVARLPARTRSIASYRPADALGRASALRDVD
jgi:putative transposase